MGRRPQRLRRIERARRRLPYALAQQALEESIVEGLERLELAKLLGSVRGSASPTAAILFWLVAQQHQQGQQEQSKLLPTNDEGPDEASDEAAAPVGSKASPGAGLKAEWGRLLFAEKRRARWALREDEALRRGLAELEEAKEKTPNQGALSLEQTRTLPSAESAADDVVLAEDDDHHDDGKDESSDDDDGSGDDSGDSEGEHDNKTADEDEGEKERRLDDSKKDKTKPAQKEAKNKNTQRKRVVSVGLWTKQWPAPKMKLLPNWPHLASTVALVLHEGDVKARETLKESGEYGDEQTKFVGTLALNQSDGGGGSLGYLCLSFRHREVDSKFGGITLSSILSSTDGDGDDDDSGGKENKKASKEGDKKKNKNGKKAGKKKKNGKKSSVRKSMSDQIAAAVRLKEEEVNVDVAVSYSEPLRPVEECLLKFLGRDGLGRLSFTCPQTSACGVGAWAGAAHRESRAKTSILGLARAFLATRKLSTLRKRLHASRVLQRNCRGFLHRCRFLGWLVPERAAYHECATSVLGPLKHGPFHAFLGRSLGPSFLGPQQLQLQQQGDGDFNGENAGGSCVAGGGQRTALLSGSYGGPQSRWGGQATTQLSSAAASSFGGVSSACVDVVFVLLKALQQGVPTLLSLGLAAPLMEALRQDTVALEGAKRRRKLLLRKREEETAAAAAAAAVKDDGATDVSSSSLGLSASPAQPPSSSRAVTRTVGDTLPCLAGSDPRDPFGGHPHSSWATPADIGDWTTNKRKQTRVSKAEENQGMGSPSRGQPLFTSRDRASYSSALQPSTEHGLKVPTVCSGDGGPCPFTGEARAAALANFAMRGGGGERGGGGGGGKDETRQVMQAVAARVSNARRLSLLKVLGAVLAHPTGRRDLLAKSAAPSLVRCWQSALLVGDYESCLQCCRIVLALVKSEPLICTHWMASSASSSLASSSSASSASSSSSAANRKEEAAAPCVALLVTALPVAMLSITAPSNDDDVHKGTFSPGSLSVTDQAACLGLDLLVALLVHSNDHKAKNQKPGDGAAASSGSNSWLSLKELAALDRGEKILAGNADAGVGTAAASAASTAASTAASAAAAAAAASVVAAATSKEVASAKALLRAWLVERTQVVPLLLGTLRELAARRQTLDHPMRYASRFSMTTSSSSAFFTSSELDQDDDATFPRLTTTRRRMLLCDYEAAKNATQARDLRLLRERRAEPQVLESAAVILWNLAGIPTSSSTTTDGGGGEEEGGGTVGRKERRLHALIHEAGAVGTVAALLRCSLWPLASRLGALLLICLAKTRAQKYDYVAAGCLPLLHQLAVLGCGVEVGPAAKRAIEALSETLKEPPAGGSFASGSHGGGVHGDFPHEVALSALDMAVFGAGWSSGSAALPLSSENIYRAKPKGVF